MAVSDTAQTKKVGSSLASLLPAAPSSLPAQPNALIGREQEVCAARERLQAEDVRLLTLTGPGGVGKTRLAVEVAAALRSAFGSGVHFVDLAPIRDPQLVIPAILQALRVSTEDERAPLDRLVAHLGTTRRLLVLDNFEQVLDAAPALVQLLEHCPRLKLLVTSREPLRLRWEHVFPVLPLPVPDEHHLPEIGALAQIPAVTLFVERAKASLPVFALSSENAAAIAQLCAGLDGPGSGGIAGSFRVSGPRSARRRDVILGTRTYWVS